MMQCWQDFKAEFLTSLYKDYHDFIYDINPEIAVECNITPPNGSNPVINRGAWAPDTYRWGHVFWAEQKEVPGVNEKGILETRIRSYKHAQASRNKTFSYNFNGNPIKLSFAEAMAFNNNCLGMVARVWDYVPSGEALQYINFFKNNQQLYGDVSSAAEVAVLNSRDTLCFHSEDPHLQLALAEQCLIQSGICFDTIYNEGLADLSKYNLLLLPDCRIMTDLQCEQVADFVKNGGSLLVTGESACYYRKHFCPRPEGSLLKNMFGEDNNSVVFIDSLVPSVTFPANEPTAFLRCRAYDHKWWALPENFSEFTNALASLYTECLFRLTAPEYVVFEAKIRKSDNAYILHFLNYDKDKNPTVVCELPAESEMTLYCPEGKEKKLTGNKIEIEKLHTYIAAEIKVI
jgi:hypothetical protein